MKDFNCNMELTLYLMGGKWKPINIYHIGSSQPIRYGELQRVIPSINKRVLSRELRELEENGIISREVFDEKILRVEYSLTEDGKELLPLFHQLSGWDKNYNKNFKYAKISCCE